MMGIILPASALLRFLPSSIVRANSTAQTLPFSQNWSNNALITVDDNWSGVPGIEGFFLNSTNSSTGIDPQTVLNDTFNGGTTTVDLDVIANQTSTAISNGGVAEFHTTPQAAPANANSTIALQGSGTADAPFILLYLNTTGQTSINVSYSLRDIDCTIDNATQPVALQFRVGSSGNYTNIPAGFVADATSRVNSTATDTANCTQVTPVSVTLPVAAENQPLVQVRIMTTNAAGNDEWVGIDDINVTAGVAPAAPNLSVTDVAQAEGNGGTTVFTFTVNLSSPAPASGVTFDIATADGTAQDDNPATEDNDYVAKSETGRTITSGNSSATFTVNVNGDTTIEPNETFFVNVTNVTGATVTDGQGQGTIQNDDVIITPIHDIQGSGSTSPLAGQTVTTTGIVTGLKTNGFFVQASEAEYDANTETSEGVFVFTSSAPPAAAAIGNRVNVTGTIQEFIPSADPNSPPATELISPTVVLISAGNTPPAPHTITAAETTAPSGTTNPLDSLEEFEGMRVTVPSLTVVAPTQGNITESSATVSSTGVFYGVIMGVARPFREPGINISDPLPPGSPANVPRFDENPQRIRVDSDAQPGSTKLDVTTGTIITNVTGPLDFSFRTYTILPDTATPPVVGTLATATAAPPPTNTEFTVASFNMERFFDTTNDPGGDPVLTTAAFNNRLNKASLIIRNVQRLPDVIGVEEIEHLSTLQAVATKVNDDAFAATGVNPNYQAFLVEGNDIGGIDVGFLVKASRVNVVDVTQIEQSGCDHVTPSTCFNYTNPNDGTLDILNDRPPLVLRATIARPGGQGTLAFTAIVNHLRSLSGVDDPADGNRIRTKRRAQAEFLANYIQSRQTADPTEKIISVGDYNAFNISDGYVDVMGTIKGTPTPPDQVVLASPDLVNPNLTNLVDALTPDQRYSFTFDGNAQVLDQILVNPNANSILNRFAYARDDADFPVVYYQDGTRPERISDHDQPIAYFSLTTPTTAGQVIVSEFRLRGLGGTPTATANNEFVEFYNNTGSTIVVSTTDGSAGWALVAADGNTRFIIPNGTVIPSHAHFLAVNTGGYNLGVTGDTIILPDGVTQASGYTSDIPDGSGIALFNTANPSSFTLANRLDAAGYAGNPSLYFETTGFPTGGAEMTQDIDYSFARDLRNGFPQDTGSNTADFIGVQTYTFGTGAATGAGAYLGAPGPENLSSPTGRLTTQIVPGSINTAVSTSASPNRVRNTDTYHDALTPSGPSGLSSNYTLGTLSVQKRFTNNTGANVSRLRFRIVDVTTLGTPFIIGSGTQADIRVLSSDGTVKLTGGATLLTVRGLTLEQSSPQTQVLGGGWNSSVVVDLSGLPGGVLAPGQSVDVQFLLGVAGGGSFRFFVISEASN
jgi:predicted extracellular nuclease